MLNDEIKKILIKKMIEKKLESNRQTHDPGNETKKVS
jgi:hypothetical protein